MNADTIGVLNFVVHSLVIGAAAWLLVRFVIRDALRRCILANLAVLMCLYTPFDIRVQDLLPKKKEEVPVWTPIRETFKADWRVSVTPASVPTTSVAIERRGWDVDEVVRGMRWLAWVVTVGMLLRLMVQSVRVQRWAWGQRRLTSGERELICGSASEFCGDAGRLESSRGLEHCFASLTLRATFGWLSPLRYGSRTLARVRVSEGASTPCVAGWFWPVIAVPVSAFGKLTPSEWGWLLRHEAEHLRLHDTVVALLQNMVRAFLWWNPFVHALVEEYARAREEACDAAAVGEGRDHTAYADFLLAWADRSAPQQECVMAIAYSRPAKRLKVRLVALMEARGVRQKLGALFVLGCLAFAVIAPVIAASFGIATAAAQVTEKAKADDGAMHTRAYRVRPDFLTAAQVQEDPFAPGKAAATDVITRKTARDLLEDRGIPFPEGASAQYNPVTAQLIVRHYKQALDQIETIVDESNKVTPLVYFQCRLIQAGSYFGVHGGILKPDEARELWRQVSQKKGIDLATLPAITTKFGQDVTNEVVKEVLPEKLKDATVGNALKLIGPSIEIASHLAGDGKALVAAKVGLGVDPDGVHPWLPQKGDKPVWDRVQFYTASAQAELASGETLVTHLATPKKNVTLLITAEALNPTGEKAASFEPTAAPRFSSAGIDVPDKSENEWSQRVYRVPPNFPKDKPPMEVLQDAGIPFEKNASAVLKDERLTVRNTKPKLDLIEWWIVSLADDTKKKSIRVTVQTAEMKGDHLKLMNDWLLALPKDQKPTITTDPTALTLAASPPTEEILRLFTTAGIFAPDQYKKVKKRIAETKVKIESLKPKGERKLYKLPDAMGGTEVKVEAQIGGDGNTIEFIVTCDESGTRESGVRRISTGVTVWGGQTFVLASQPSDGVSRFLFITGEIEEKAGKK